jgi:tartrate-resistant acid phosphatase type 5
MTGFVGSPQTHFEPFLHLAGLGDDEALIAWGGFYFVKDGSRYGEWRIADDEELTEICGQERTETIGARSEPFGEAVVEVERKGEVVARAETDECNHVWVRGLEPNTEYTYRVIVDGGEWAAGELFDWDTDRRTLVPGGRYVNRFQTFPSPEASTPLTFGVIGDFGIGILLSTEDSERQLAIARTLERAVDEHDLRLVVTVGDNIYLGEEHTVSGSGNEDDDWYASFYEPYRYVLNRVPCFPAVGNHDAADSEESDDRAQLDDNYFIHHRFDPGVTEGRSSMEPGLFYRVGFGSDVDFIAIDTSLADELAVEHFFDDPAHRDWVRESLQESDARWLIPFCHHPPFCAGPKHFNTEGMVERLVPLFEESGVRLVLSGHEHNFQYSVVDGIHYVVSGAAGKLRPEKPTGFADASTVAWAVEGHLLVVRIDGDRAEVTPLGPLADDGSLQAIEILGPEDEPVATPIVIDAR